MHISRSINSASLYSPQGRRKYLTPPERSRFIAAAANHPRPDVRTLCLVLVYSGCRISEALALVSSSIEPEERFIAIHSLKKRKNVVVIRQVPIPAFLVKVLIEVHGLTMSNAKLWGWSRSRAWQLVKSVMVEADIAPGLHATPKGLRHGFGVHAVRNGVPLNLVQRWMGHASLATTAIYLDVIGDEEREIAQRMWRDTTCQIVQTA